MPACAGLLELTGSRLELQKIAFNAKILYAGGLGLSLPFRRNSFLKCVSQPKITKNSRKPLIWGVKSRSMSSMLIKLISCLHDSANVQQTSSKLPANIFKIHVLNC